MSGIISGIKQMLLFDLDCECDTPGVKKENNVYIGTCDLVSGQCECATEAIFGRRCEECARGTKSMSHLSQITLLRMLDWAYS